MTHPVMEPLSIEPRLLCGITKNLIPRLIPIREVLPLWHEDTTAIDDAIGTTPRLSRLLLFLSVIAHQPA